MSSLHLHRISMCILTRPWGVGGETQRTHALTLDGTEMLIHQTECAQGRGGWAGTTLRDVPYNQWGGPRGQKVWEGHKQNSNAPSGVPRQANRTSPGVSCMALMFLEASLFFCCMDGVSRQRSISWLLIKTSSSFLSVYVDPGTFCSSSSSLLHKSALWASVSPLVTQSTWTLLLRPF